MDFVSYNLKLFLRTAWSYMGPQITWNHVHGMKKIFRLCSYTLWDPLVTLQMSPTTASSSHIRRSISRPSVLAAVWCVAAVFARLQTSAERSPHPSRIWRCHLTPCNMSHTSNPFSRKHCVEIGTEPCVEMWWCTILLKNHGTVFLMLKLWLQTALKHCRDGKRGERKYLYVADGIWQRGMRNCQEGICKICVIRIHVLFYSENHQYTQPIGNTFQTN